jgi:hypothetical protein
MHPTFLIKRLIRPLENRGSFRWSGLDRSPASQGSINAVIVVYVFPLPWHPAVWLLLPGSFCR